MAKYYVKCGGIKYIIDCNNHDSAILSALYHYRDKKIIMAPKICVSETGFIDIKKWTCYDVEDYLKRM